MAEYPPLNRSYVVSYAANDKDYPVIGIKFDPRVAGYRVPEDLSPHPDSKRYPNHIFTGAQPANSDERVTHIYEILPAPWVPFTRYDDDLGPIQGRRRSVKNEGQQASLASDKRVNYEAREGSAIVYTELEETWSIKTDEDGNSLFPVKDRDFYDASRGAVQERRQLIVPTGEEFGSLENINGVITQTSYEPYNEFLSVKIVQTYRVVGPQLVGKTTDNDGQFVTVTTQRKGALNYTPPTPTATRTVEVSREDAESLIERIVDTPEIFTAKTFSVERPDPIPQKFRTAIPITSNQEIVRGDAEIPTLLPNEISRSEEQQNKFVKRTTVNSRDQTQLPKTLIQKDTNNDGQTVVITETLQLGDTNEIPSATKTVQSEALGDGNFIVRKTEVPKVFEGKSFTIEKPDNVPPNFRAKNPTKTTELTLAGIATEPELISDSEISKSEQQINEFLKRTRTTSRSFTKETLTGALYTSELGGGIADVTEIYPFDEEVPSDPEFGLISDSIENLGDGTRLRRKVRLPRNDYISGENSDFWTDGGVTYSGASLPILSGQDYDEELDIVIPYKQVVAKPTNQALSQGKRRRVTPRDVAHSVVQKYNIEDIQDSLDEYYWEIPDMIGISLPNKLKSVELLSDFSTGTSESNSAGNTYSTSYSNRSSVGGTISYDIEEGFQGNIPTIRAIFFLPKENSSPDAVLSKVQAKRNDSTIKFWPNVRPKSYQIAIVSSSQFEEISESASYDSNSESKSIGASVSTSIATIPPTIHDDIFIQSSGDSPVPISGNEAGRISISPRNLTATSYSQFPTGLFIYQINSTPYKFSYTRIDALLVSITNEYV